MKKIRVIVVMLVLLVLGTSVLVGCDSGNLPPDNNPSISYEDILNEYTQKLQTATPTLIDEFREEAESNQDGVTGLATLSNIKTSKLAEICTEGTQKMATLYYLKGGEYSEYSEWAGKLTDVYMVEGLKIHDVYIELALEIM